jgi:hypothetical protein
VPTNDVLMVDPRCCLNNLKNKRMSQCNLNHHHHLSHMLIILQALQCRPPHPCTHLACPSTKIYVHLLCPGQKHTCSLILDILPPYNHHLTQDYPYSYPSNQSTLVFESPVRSGYWVPRGSNQDQDRLAFVPKPKIT